MGPSQEALELARNLLKGRTPEEVSRLEIELAYYLQGAGDKWLSDKDQGNDPA